MTLARALDKFKALVRAGDAAALDALLTAHPELKATLDDPHFDFGSTALIIAKSNLPLVDILLRHGADINAASQWWAGDFHILELADAQLAAALVERGARVSVHAAAEQGWLDWLETAYASDPDIVKSTRRATAKRLCITPTIPPLSTGCCNATPTWKRATWIIAVRHCNGNSPKASWIPRVS